MLQELLRLYSVFFRIGVFSIGGGYVMLAMLQDEVVEKYKWLTHEELLNYYAISQAAPGIIAINTATFVGYKRGGVLGAVIATAGMVTPSLIIITIIAIFFTRFQENIYVQRAFAGIRVAVSMLLIWTVTTLTKQTIKNLFGILIVVSAFSLVVIGGISPIPIILASAAVGIIHGYARKGGA